MVPCSTPVRSPQFNGMAEAFVKTSKRDYVWVNQLPDAMTVIAQLSSLFEHYKTLRPHKALEYCSPREFLIVRQKPDPVRFLKGNSSIRSGLYGLKPPALDVLSIRRGDVRANQAVYKAMANATTTPIWKQDNIKTTRDRDEIFLSCLHAI